MTDCHWIKGWQAGRAFIAVSGAKLARPLSSQGQLQGNPGARDRTVSLGSPGSQWSGHFDHILGGALRQTEGPTLPEALGASPCAMGGTRDGEGLLCCLSLSLLDVYFLLSH